MILKITPKIQYGSQMMNLQPMFLQGENVKNASYPVVNYDKGTSFTQKMSFKMCIRDSLCCRWRKVCR